MLRVNTLLQYCHDFIRLTYQCLYYLEDKKTIKAGSPVLIDDEDDKSAVKEEKKVKPSQGRTTRSSSAAGVKKVKVWLALVFCGKMNKNC